MRRVSIGVVLLAVTAGTLVAAPAVADDALHTVFVDVTTEHGTPIAGADVGLGVSYGNIASARSDDAGVATFTEKASGQYTVYVVGPAGPAFTQDVTVGDEDASVTVVETGVVMVSGQVRDVATSKGTAASVLLASSSGDGYYRTESQDDGRFAVTVMAGTYVLSYSAYGYETGYFDDAASEAKAKPLALSASDVKDLVLPLHHDGALAGKVTLAGKAKPDATVIVSAADQAWTSANGSWSFSSPTSGTYRPYVVGVAGSYFTTYYGNTVRRPDAKGAQLLRDHTTNVDIAVVAAATITGTVLNAKGKPAKDIDVEAYNLTRAGSASTTTDSHGRYTLRGLATGPVAVAAYGTGYSSSVHKVSAVQGKTVTAATFKASNDAQLAGTIRTTGSKPSSQDVSLFDSHHTFLGTFRPDADGSIGLWSMAAGTYYLTIDGSNVQKKIKVKAHQHVKFGTLTRGRLVTVSGTVKTAAGKAAVGAKVALTDAHQTSYKTVRTDSHGHYSLKAAVSGTYYVDAVPKSKGVDAGGEKKIKVKAGHSAKVNVRLTRSATITGRVVNAHGLPAVGVHVVTPDGSDVKTNASGVYKIIGLYPSSVYVLATDADYVGGYRDAGRTVKLHAGRTTTVPTIKVS